MLPQAQSKLYYLKIVWTAQPYWRESEVRKACTATSYYILISAHHCPVAGLYFWRKTAITVRLESWQQPIDEGENSFFAHDANELHMVTGPATCPGVSWTWVLKTFGLPTHHIHKMRLSTRCCSMYYRWKGQGGREFSLSSRLGNHMRGF